MEEEIQELRELIEQAKADNERLRKGQAGPSPLPSISLAPPVAPSTSSPSVAERLIFVPRERKCSIFSGRTGIGLSEWVGEVETIMRTWLLSWSDQAFFLLDHLEGEAKDEIRYRSAAEREDPFLNTCHFRGAVRLLRVLRRIAAGFIYQETAGGRNASEVLPCVDGPHGEGEAERPH